MKLLRVFDKDLQRYLTAAEVLQEVNRDRSEDFTPYDSMDLLLNPEDVADWIDSQFYDVLIEEVLK
jgi:hypothetical protein